MRVRALLPSLPRPRATASRLAQLTVVDCMFVGVAQRTYAETREALAATYDAVRSLRRPEDLERV